MFKYLWIIMLVFFALAFVGYTVFAIYKSAKEAIDYAETVYDSSVDIKWILSETWDNFVNNYDLLTVLWLIILVIVSVALFVISLDAYASSATLGG